MGEGGGGAGGGGALAALAEMPGVVRCLEDSAAAAEPAIAVGTNPETTSTRASVVLPVMAT
jgi:hypothetical protein